MTLTDTQVIAKQKGIILICSECPCELTDEELRAAIAENIKEPVCDDCYADFFTDAVNEEWRKHHD